MSNARTTTAAAAALLLWMGDAVAAEDPILQHPLAIDGRTAALVPAAGPPEAAASREDPGGGIASITWEKMTVPPNLFLRAISMASPQVGFAAGELGVVVRSTDGGDTWQTILNQGFPYYWYGVHALDELNVIISGFQNQTGEGIIRWSHDGGGSWGPIISLPSPAGIDWLIGVEFATDTFGVIQGFSGQVFVTTTGGLTADDWTVSLPSNNWYLGTFTVLPDGRIWISGFDTVYSDDFGQEWTMLPGADPLFDGPIAILPTGFGFTGGGSIAPQVAGWIYGTSNGGQSWSDRLITTPYPIRALQLLDKSRAWAAGGNFFSNVGGIWGTENGGETWTLEQDIGNEMLDMDLVQIDANTFDAYAAGSVSQIWRARVTVAGCYPDFDGNGDLNLFDFLAYTNAFNAADPSADCDASGALNLFDFLCFTNAFNQGC